MEYCRDGTRLLLLCDVLLLALRELLWPLQRLQQFDGITDLLLDIIDISVIREERLAAYRPTTDASLDRTEFNRLTIDRGFSAPPVSLGGPKQKGSSPNWGVIFLTGVLIFC